MRSVTWGRFQNVISPETPQRPRRRTRIIILRVLRDLRGDLARNATAAHSVSSGDKMLCHKVLILLFLKVRFSHLVAGDGVNSSVP